MQWPTYYLRYGWQIGIAQHGVRIHDILIQH